MAEAAESHKPFSIGITVTKIVFSQLQNVQIIQHDSKVTFRDSPLGAIELLI